MHSVQAADRADLTVCVYCYTSIPGCQCDLTRTANWNRIELSFLLIQRPLGPPLLIILDNLIGGASHWAIVPHTRCPPLHILNICHLWHIVLTPVVAKGCGESGKPLCKQSSGCWGCDVGSRQGPEHRSDMCEAERGEVAGSSWVCVCSSMLLLTQCLTVHPLTTLRSRQCVQMRWCYIYSRAVQAFKPNPKLSDRISDFANLCRLCETKGWDLIWDLM